jgi:hypothetical protein
VTPSLTGVPLGGAGTVRFSLTSAVVKDVPITISAGDASIISVGPNPVTIAAGQAFVDVVVSGLAPGNTAVTGTSAQGAASAIVSVSQMAAGATLNAFATTAGVSVLTPPSTGVVVTAPSHQNTVRVGILDVASQTATAISITSTNPDVATATAASIPPGQQAVDLVVTSGQAGVATLVIRAGDAIRSVTIIVSGSTATAVPAVLAKPAGVAALVPPSAGHVLTKPDTQSIVSVGPCSPGIHFG